MLRFVKTLIANQKYKKKQYFEYNYHTPNNKKCKITRGSGFYLIAALKKEVKLSTRDLASPRDS